MPHSLVAEYFRQKSPSNSILALVVRSGTTSPYPMADLSDRQRIVEKTGEKRQWGEEDRRESDRPRPCSWQTTAVSPGVKTRAEHTDNPRDNSASEILRSRVSPLCVAEEGGENFRKRRATSNNVSPFREPCTRTIYTPRNDTITRAELKGGSLKSTIAGAWDRTSSRRDRDAIEQPIVSVFLTAERWFIGRQCAGPFRDKLAPISDHASSLAGNIFLHATTLELASTRCRFLPIHSCSTAATRTQLCDYLWVLKHFPGQDKCITIAHNVRNIIY